VSERIQVGIVAFAPPPSFRDVLENLKRHVDSIIVVYGRFLGFDHPEVHPPGYIEDHADLILSDRKLPQSKQRDLYLKGLEEGDMFFFMDCDWIPTNPETFRNMSKIDATAFSFKVIGGGSQQLVCGYKYREGFRHSTGGLFIDKDGKYVTTPAYRCHNVPAHVNYYLHNCRWDPKNADDIRYREAQLAYFKGLSSQ
jgi:hypothetical protein